MTVRPRATLRTRTHDLRDLAIAVVIHARPLVGTVAPHVHLIAVAALKEGHRILTSRYTDPQEPR